MNLACILYPQHKNAGGPNQGKIRSDSSYLIRCGVVTCGVVWCGDVNGLIGAVVVFEMTVVGCVVMMCITRCSRVCVIQNMYVQGVP